MKVYLKFKMSQIFFCSRIRPSSLKTGHSRMAGAWEISPSLDQADGWTARERISHP